MKESIYLHFRPEERPFAERIAEWSEQCARYHETKRTDFLDPRQANIVSSLVSRFPELSLTLEGGYEGAERKRALIIPEYLTPNQEDAGLELLSISGDTRFLALEHSDYLGALLGLGMKRDKIGDILVHDKGCHLIVAEEISSFIRMQMTKVNRLSVKVETVDWNELIVPEVSMERIEFTVPSMRLDVVAGDVHRLSRAKIAPFIQAGRVKVNWKVTTDASELLKDGDWVSIQGLGRFKVIEVEGPTKKGRLRLKIGKMI